MSDRVNMSFEDVKKFTTHQAHQNEVAAAKTVANVGECAPKEASLENAKKVTTGDGM